MSTISLLVGESNKENKDLPLLDIRIIKFAQFP
jgi:hypothetical protein